MDEEIKGIQGEIKSLEVMYEIHSLQQTLDKYEGVETVDILKATEFEKELAVEQKPSKQALWQAKQRELGLNPKQAGKAGRNIKYH
ncbi:MAG: hypothetical protein BroJett005_30770 [Ignavibacteriota bacterium]|nr:MAG: hypothetical protein BroJett005_30770 [Ignavibacteriota bacterium]